MGTHNRAAPQPDDWTTLVALLAERARTAPDTCAYTFLSDTDEADRTLTYAELDRRARTIAAALQRTAAPGERALLLYPPGLEYVAAFFGCLYAGVIAVPAYPPNPAHLERTLPRLSALAASARPAVALTTSQIAPLAQLLGTQEPAFAGVDWLATDALEAGLAAQWREPELAGETLAFLQYTSGSTATPRGVMLTHRNLLHNSALIRHAFGHSAGSRGVIWLPPYHDMGLIGGVIQPLYAGFPVALMSPVAFLQRPLRWLEAITRFRATTSGGPNFAFELCVRKTTPEQRATLDLSSWDLAFTGAEPVRAETLDRFAATFAPCGFRRTAFYPCYGLAEATLIVSGGRKQTAPMVGRFATGALARHLARPAAADEDGQTLVGCGAALPSLSVAIVDPQEQIRCDPGAVGEIWVAGPSVARGYWERPEDSARTFRASLPGGSGPFLRTGDLGFVQDGELFVTGRIKDLIIIRGRNHYPQDIEQTVERSHPALRPGCGAAFAVEIDGEERLVVVQEVERQARNTDLGAAIQAIRRAVAAEHELAVHAVALIKPGAIPKTSSGKIQRHACKAEFVAGRLPLLAADSAPAAPAAALPDRATLLALPPERRAALLAEALCGTLAGALRLPPEQIPLDRPVSALGLDSLAAVDFQHTLEQTLGVVVPMVWFLEDASPADLAARLAALLDAPAEPAPAPNAGERPLTVGQQALWFLHQLAPDSPAYTIARAAELRGPLDQERLRRVLDALVARHAALRTVFPARSGAPVQELLPDAQAGLAVTDAAGWTPAQLDQALATEAQRPFDLQRGPLMRVRLYRHSAERHTMLLAFHHSIVDLWSLMLLARELAGLYAGDAIAPGPSEHALLDHARRQRRWLDSDEAARQWEYWRQELAGPLPALDLPTDRPRPPLQTYGGAELLAPLDPQLTAGLRALAARAGVTLYTLLLAAFQTLLHRSTGQSEILVGTPTAGRSRAETASAVGYFVNPVVLRADLAGNPGFDALLEQTRQRVHGALAHQDYPFARLVERLLPERDPARSPLFQAMFVLERAHQFADLAGFVLGEPSHPVPMGAVQILPRPLPQPIAQFDLTLTLVDAGERLGTSFQYNTGLFDSATIERMAARWQTLLHAIVEAPQTRVGDLPLLPEEERALLERWNQTGAPFPQNAALHELFAEQARRTPEAIALIDGPRRVSYRDLDLLSARIAQLLRREGVRSEQRVGVVMRRSTELVATLLGVLRAGATYVPLDPAYPPERNQLTLDDSDAVLVLADSSERASALRLPPGCRLLVLSGSTAALAGLPATAPVVAVDPQQLAYLIYTSGSTGRPKGVAIRHASAVALMAWAREVYSPQEMAGVLATTSVCFDVSVFELFAPLSWGGTVILAENVLALPDLPAREHVTLVSTVPSAVSELLALADLPAGARTVNLAGEPLPRAVVDRVFQQPAVERIWNQYGPSEDTTFSTVALITRDDPGAPTIGRPLPNTRVHLLDARLRPVPVGVIGRVYLSGAGLARGYLGRPDLTAERFLPDPFSDQPGARMYDVGDLARYRADGVLLYQGRTDHQVKLRGFRIELGEIESALRRHPALRDVVVVAREDTPGDKRIVAYLVLRQEPEDQNQEPRTKNQESSTGDANNSKLNTQHSKLRSYLAGQLPGYMIPSAFVLLSALPLLPNGKVDRNALPAPEWERAADAGELVAPRTSAERLVAEVWAEVIGLAQVGAQDHFFAIGGHSLLATQVVARLRERAGVDLPLRQIFDTPTVAGLAQALERLHPANLDMVRPADRSAPLPLSFAQQRLWFLEQLEPGSGAYHMPAAIRLRGALDQAALQRSLAALIARHEALRTTFPAVDGQPSQRINPPALPELEHEDLRGLDAPERQRHLEARMRAEARRPFDLERGPLLRARLFLLGDDEHVLHLTLHHIIFDGWSVGVFVRELSAIYAAERTGQTAALPPLPVQYADAALWQREQLQSGALDGQRAYWLRQLAGPLPPLDLPADRPRPPAPSYRGDQVALTLPAGLTERLRQLGQSEGATLFMTALAAVDVLLSRYSGQDDLLIGTPIAGRTRPEQEPLVGLFVNTLVLRTDLGGNPPFRTLLGRVRATALDAYAHQDLPFELLVEELQPERRLERNPLFQVMCVFQNTPAPALELAGLALEPLELHAGTAQLDLALTFTERPGGLHVAAEFATDLFDAGTIERMLGHYHVLLEGIVENPDQRLADLPLLAQAERQQLLGWNQPSAPFSDAACAHQLFEAQAARTPEATALEWAGQRLSYHELNTRANRVAHHLRALGAGPEQRVGICMGRTGELIIALLGVLKAGAAYVPLDPAYPPERLRFMVQDAQVRVLLAHQETPTPWFSGTTVDLAADWPLIAQQPASNPATGIGPEQLAYVIYTSGSTGQPKGVLIEHRSLVNYIEAMRDFYAATSVDRMLQFSSISFDASAEEIYIPLISGAALVLRSEEMIETVETFLRTCAAWQISTLSLPTAFWHELVARLAADSLALPGTLRLVVIGGERALPERVALWQRQVGARVRLLNSYGPTEATIAATVYEVPAAPLDSQPAEVPIGRPVRNLAAYLLDRSLNLVPVGIPGELCIGGAGLARGYLGRPDLTAERFVPNPFGEGLETRDVRLVDSEPLQASSLKPLASRLYKTGDLARLLPDGTIEFLGRVDQQVKIRGFRIELGEVEAALRQSPLIAEAVVMAREDQPGDKRLVAYIVPAEEPRTKNQEPNSEAGGLRLEASTLKTHLRERLPDYMVPAVFVTLPALPVTPGGKLDRKALPAPDTSRLDLGSGLVPPRTPTEEQIAAVWQSVLRLERVGVHDNFFELGGHSLLATQVAARTRAGLGVELPLRRIFEHPTVAELAAFVDESRRNALPPIAPAPRDGELPLSFAQHRLWLLEQLAADAPLYTIGGLVELNGPLDPDALGRAFNALVARHEVLRSHFPVVGGQPALRIDPPAPLAIPRHDLRELPGEQCAARVQALAEAAVRQPFDLAAGPLIRATLLRTAADRHMLVLTMHHIVSDGWSLGVMLDELRALYRAGAPPLPDLPLQYADYAVWQRGLIAGEHGERLLAYWRQQLAGAPPLINLPLDRPRPPVQDHAGAREPLAFERALADRLQALSRNAGVTLFMTMLAAFKVVLHHYAGQSEIVVGTPVAGRPLPELERLIGCFVNTLALRTDLGGNPTFRTLLQRVREVALGAYDHQDLPFEQLVAALQPRRDPAYHSLFQVWFVLQNTPMPELALGDVVLRALEAPAVTVRHDLRLDLTETPDGLVGSFEYKTGLFDRATIIALAGQLRAVLERVAGQPEASLDDLRALLAERDQQRDANLRRDTVAGDLQKLRARRRRLDH